MFFFLCFLYIYNVIVERKLSIFILDSISTILPLLDSDSGHEDVQFDYLTTAMEVLPMISPFISDKSCIPLGTGRVEDYVEKTVPTYSDPMFRAHFRRQGHLLRYIELLGM